MKRNYEVSFSSNTLGAKRIVSEALNFVKRAIPGMADTDLCDLRLILSELTYNAVIHGNNGDSEKNVFIRIDISADTVFATISDEGRGFDYNSIINSSYDDPLNMFSEHGRGIRLVTSLVDSYKFNKRGNKIQFSKKVGHV